MKGDTEGFFFEKPPEKKVVRTYKKVLINDGAKAPLGPQYVRPSYPPRVSHFRAGSATTSQPPARVKGAVAGTILRPIPNQGRRAGMGMDWRPSWGGMPKPFPKSAGRREDLPGAQGRNSGRENRALSPARKGLKCYS